MTPHFSFGARTFREDLSRILRSGRPTADLHVDRSAPGRLRRLGDAWRARRRSRVPVVEEQRGAGVERADPRQLLVGEPEVEDVEVLRHPLGTHRLGDGDHTPPGQPAQHHLRHRLAVSLADVRRQRVGEQVVPPLGEAAPRLDPHPVFAHEALAVGVCEVSIESASVLAHEVRREHRRERRSSGRPSSEALSAASRPLPPTATTQA